MEISYMLAQDGESGGRGYWFIAIMVILAIQHVSEVLKKRREAKEMAARGYDPDEEEIDFDWEEDQTVQTEGYRDPAPANETLLEFFRNVGQQGKEVVQEALSSEPEPPRRKSGPAVPRAKVEPVAARLTKAEQDALAKVKAGKSHLNHGRTHRQRMHASAEHSQLGNMLRNPVSLRNAFILKEILEPPVSSREEHFPHEV